MRYSEFDTTGTERLDEIGPLISIANWFSQKYHDAISMGANKLGQGEVQRFTNQHLRAFMQFMGRYKLDWPTLKLYVVYQYLRLMMHLNDDDILDVVNEVLRDPKIHAKPMTSIQQIQDKQKTTMVSSLSKAGGDPKKMGQLIAEMILAAGAIRQMERHWEKQAGSGRMAPGGSATAGVSTTVSSKQKAHNINTAPKQQHTVPTGKTAAKPSATPAPAAGTSSQLNPKLINAALAQLGATNP